MLPIKIDLPKGFLEQEERWDYTIPTEMKKVWAVELDLLWQFDQLCRKHNITYFVSSGTVLGAIRHQGFIPWDDDIDVMLHRNEYDRLLSVAPSEIKAPYFFQSGTTDSKYPRSHVQLRNSLTTGILKNELNYKFPFNQGIFIDVFPIDNVPDDEEERQLFIRQVREQFYSTKRIHYYLNKYKTDFDMSSLLKFPRYLYETLKYKLNGSKEICFSYNKLCSRYKEDNTQKCMSFCLPEDKYIFDNVDIATPVYMPFEMLNVPVPNGYYNYLKQCYGNWEVPIKTGSYHGSVVFDAEKPYQEYLEKMI